MDKTLIKLVIPTVLMFIARKAIVFDFKTLSPSYILSYCGRVYFTGGDELVDQQKKK